MVSIQPTKHRQETHLVPLLETLEQEKRELPDNQIGKKLIVCSMYGELTRPEHRIQRV
jgi:hypothetical protein